MKINPKELQQIIKEEALRLKKRMMLESEKSSILKQLQELNECDDMGMMEDAQSDNTTDSGVSIKPEIESVIEKRTNSIVNQLKPEQIAQAQRELSALGIEPGASQGEIESKLTGMLPINESMINEAWDKSKIYNWLTGAGLGSILAGIATSAIAALPLEQASNFADYTNGTVAPTPAIIIGLVVAALGVASTVIGMKGNQGMADANKKPMSPQDAQRMIAQRKLKHGR